jgi:hypothetical protein
MDQVFEELTEIYRPTFEVRVLNVGTNFFKYRITGITTLRKALGDADEIARELEDAFGVLGVWPDEQYADWEISVLCQDADHKRPRTLHDYTISVVNGESFTPSGDRLTV